jgi:hypothetical protein
LLVGVAAQGLQQSSRESALDRFLAPFGRRQRQDQVVLQRSQAGFQFALSKRLHGAAMTRIEHDQLATGHVGQRR